MKKNLLSAALAAVLGLAGAPVLAETWTADTSHSAVGFSVRHMMVSNVKGAFNKFTATVEGSPADPASDRKHGVNAVIRRGSAASARIWPCTALVRLTSAVGIIQRPSVVLNKSSANLGNWPVPNTASSFTKSGGMHSR